MRVAELGYLLLAETLGDPAQKPLTSYQLKVLAQRVRAVPQSMEERELSQGDLMAMGYSGVEAGHILELLSRQTLLDDYLSAARRQSCTFTTRISGNYPVALKAKLGLDAPGALWMKGDTGLLHTPMISLVGSRELGEENLEFAREVGIQAARQGYTLVSGNARGADQAAQNACLEKGGSVISVVADSLLRQKSTPGVLYISENGFDEGFSSQRAHSRNRIIHCLGEKVFVAQSSMEAGGTWQGTVRNLKRHWSSVFVFLDESQAMEELVLRGAAPVCLADLQNIAELKDNYHSFFEK